MLPSFDLSQSSSSADNAELGLSSDDAGAVDLLARRVRLLGWALSAQIAFFFLAGNAVAMISPEARWSDWISPANGFLVAAAVVFTAMALACSRRRPERIVRAADAIGISLGVGLVAMVGGYSSPAQRPELSVACGFTIVLVLRAILVPSTWRRTLLIGALSSAPVVMVAWVAHTGQPRGEWNLPIALYPAITALWAALAVATSVLASRVIFGLRARVDRAMQLGQYVLEEKIGEGGMGVVYRARHAMLRRPTAVKLLDPTRAGDDALARFEREVTATSRLTHPNTVAVYDYGRTQDGTFYYAMELLDGIGLDQLVAHAGPLPPGRALHLLAQISASLAEAHAAGLVHRDVKPANVMLCQRSGAADVVKVLDFGLVKEIGSDDAALAITPPLAHADVARTQAGVVMGTPLYLAPEAIRGEEVDARADIYSLGCVAYFLLTGTDAFAAPSLGKVLDAHLKSEPPSMSERLADVDPSASPIPEDLEALVRACLEREAGARPKHARELRERLSRCKDFGTWSEDDAHLWWKRQSTMRLAASRPDTSEELAATLAVDWTERLDRAG